MLGRDGLHQRPGELENGHPAAGTDVYHSYDDNVGGDDPSSAASNGGGEEARKVQRGQITTLAKMLGALRR